MFLLRMRESMSSDANVTFHARVAHERLQIRTRTVARALRVRMSTDCFCMTDRGAQIRYQRWYAPGPTGYVDAHSIFRYSSLC